MNFTGYIVVGQGVGYNDEYYYVGGDQGDSSAYVVQLKVYQLEADAVKAAEATARGMLDGIYVGNFYDYDLDEQIEPAIRWLREHGHTVDDHQSWEYTQFIDEFEKVERGESWFKYVPSVCNIVQVEIDRDLTKEELDEAKTGLQKTEKHLSGT